jgi:uncharacterized protein YgiM (DUF1202 family)
MLQRTTMLGIAAGWMLLAAALPASAQESAPTRVRVKAKSAKVMNTTAMTSDVVEDVPEGTELDVLLSDDGWYWVVLPRDGYGTRRGGWVRVRDVEGTDPAELSAKAAKAQAKRAAKESKRQQLEEKRAAKAQQRTLKAEQRAAASEARRAEKAEPKEPKEPKPRTTRADAEQARRLKKAQDDLDKARADYEAALKRKSESGAATPPAPQR